MIVQFDTHTAKDQTFGLMQKSVANLLAFCASLGNGLRKISVDKSWQGI